MNNKKGALQANGLTVILALAFILSLLLFYPMHAYAEDAEPTVQTEAGGNAQDPALSGEQQEAGKAPAAQGAPDGELTDESTETSDPAAGGGSKLRGSGTGTDNQGGSTGSAVDYVYDAELYDPDSGDYPGVYTTQITPNEASAEEAKTSQTIGMPSIADQNLDTPTTESPAIIQGAAVGYEEKTGATEYTTLRDRPEPYSEFTVKVVEEQGADGTTHRKLSGFDGTYVIVRLDVSPFFSGVAESISELYLHMEQKDNKALMPAATVAKPAADATGAAAQVDPADYTPTNSFTDGLGNRSASYKLSDLLDGNTPFLDIILYATAANVAGADAGKENVANGDVPLALYIDSTKEYNSELVEYDPSNTANVDPNATTGDKTAEAYTAKWHAKFFDATKDAISRFLVKGSDLALETAVEDSGGENKDTGTTYWSLEKSIQDSYYDLPIDADPEDTGSGRTVKMMSEVAITGGLTLEGSDENHLKKRTLDVNSFDIQVANNTGVEGSAAESITLKNGWLTIADHSNTTGAEMAIGNNAQFVIDQGGKLIIDETCQLEIEWDGATTTTPADSQTQPDILNNGQLDLRAGGEIINNGIITIEGTEGKPIQPGSGTEQQTIDSEKGSGEMTIREGATLTNNGALVVYGKLTNNGTLVNNGKYDDVIKSNDPDKGAFDYHKGIQVAWKDDVTQNNIEAGSLINGETGKLINNGDIVLTPGTLENNGELTNEAGANIYSATATEAIIPITPDPNTPTVVSKRITLSPVKLSSIVNNGSLVNNGSIAPATVALLDNTGAFDKLTTPGNHPELFGIKNNGTIINNGFIYVWNGGNGAELLSAFSGSERTVDDTWLYLYADGTFRLVFADGTELSGTFAFDGGRLVFTLDDGTELAPAADAAGNWVYVFPRADGEVEFVLRAELVSHAQAQLAQNETPDKIQVGTGN